MSISALDNRPHSPVVDWLIERVALLLNVASIDVDTAAPLAELGMDSVGAVGLVGEVEDEWQIDVDPTMIFDYPTIDDIAAFIVDEIEREYEQAS